MADLHAKKGEFAGISKEDAHRYCRSAVGIINRYASAVIAVSCDLHEVGRSKPDGAPVDANPITYLVRSPYNVCLHWAMMLLGGGVLRDGQRIEYWFEQGDNFQSASRRFLETLKDERHEPLRYSYCYGSDAFVPKADEPLFDAADFVAWEWGKHIDRVRARQHVRPSLIAVMGDDCLIDGTPFHRSDGRHAIHACGEPLDRFFRKLAALIQAKTPEEVEAAQNMT